MAGITIRGATDDDFEQMAAFDGRAFGEVWKPEELAAVRPTLELDRFHLAHDGDALVGVSGIFSQELTVPGGGIVPSGGLTWIAVAPTHRRQGVLTRLMAELHADIDGRGEPMAMLMASEGSIYERFGYGIASHTRMTEIDRGRARVRPDVAAPPGSVELTTMDDERLVGLFDRYRRQGVGEIRRSAEWFASAKVGRGDGVTVAVHTDGFAAWKVTGTWTDGYADGELKLFDMVTCTPAAHAALWSTVLGVDLVRMIRSERAVTVDDTLPFLLTDQRTIRTTNLIDMMWLNPRDVGRCLAARTYGTDDQFVIEVEGREAGERAERWRVTGSPDGAEVRKVRRRPDVTMNRADLGAIYLGGVRPSTLVRAGRIAATDAKVVRRADAFFAADRTPNCMTGF